MPLILVFFVVLVLALFVYYQFIASRACRAPTKTGDRPASKDPRVALAAMMYAVATEDGPLTPVQEQRILSAANHEGQGSGLISPRRASRAASAWPEAFTATSIHACISSLRRSRPNAAWRKSAIVVDMLHLIAGANADRIGSVREGLGRLSSSLLRG